MSSATRKRKSPDGAAAEATAGGAGGGAGAGSSNGSSTSSTKAITSAAEWKKARVALLEREKELSKLKDKLNAERLKLPMYQVTKEYVFTDTAGKDYDLAQLFGPKHDQLILVHFMWDPSWPKGCQSCSMWADAYSGIQKHLDQKTAFVVAAKAEHDKIAEFQKWKGYSFRFLSSAKSSFNKDFDVEFTAEEIKSGATKYNYGRSFPASQCPGYSVFYKDADGKVYHTYSTFARGMEVVSPVYGFFDMLPRGRDEKRNMDWLKHKELYDA